MLSNIISNTILRTTYIGVRGIRGANQIRRPKGVFKEISADENFNPIKITHPRSFIPKGEKGRKLRNKFKESPLAGTRDIYDIYNPIAIQEV